MLIDLDLGPGYEFPPDQVYDETGKTPTEGYDAQYVVASLKACGSKYTAISDWALLDYDDVTITVTVISDDGRRTFAQW